jgi:hypothetical protein
MENVDEMMSSMAGMSREDIMNMVNGEDSKDGETLEVEKPTEEIQAQPELEKIVEPEVKQEEAVILTKDGKHTINFDEYRSLKDKVIGLTDQSSALMATLESQKVMIQQLLEARAIDDKTGNSDATDEVVEGFRLDDLDEELPGIKNEILNLIKPLQTELAAIKAEKQQKDDLTAQEQAEAQARQDFDAEVTKFEPDYLKVTAPDNQKFWDWYNSDDRSVRVRNDGVSSDPQRVANVVKAFKDETKATGGDTSGLTVEETAKKVAEALAKADEGNAVQSLGDVPGGTNPIHDEIQATLNLSPAGMADKLKGKSREQIEDIISRANRAVR